MHYARLFTLLIAIAFSGAALADRAAEVEAGKLIDAMQMQATMDQSIDALLDLQVQQNKELAPYRGVMHDFFNKYMSVAALRNDLVALYVSEFSAAEMRKAREFYETPTGRKLVARMPALMSKGAELGSRAVQAHLPELAEMIRVEQERLQKAADAAAAPTATPAPTPAPAPAPAPTGKD